MLQDAPPRIVYDLHQFMGAMGLTLEHPLYRWSYRVKRLVSNLAAPRGSFATPRGILCGDGPDAGEHEDALEERELGSDITRTFASRGAAAS